MKNIFYAYIYLDPRKPGKFKYDNLLFDYEPFYVGKGKDNRIDAHLYCYDAEPNKYKNNKIKKIIRLGLIPIAVYIKENISEKEAHDLEIKTIASIGRFKYKKIVTHKIGPLLNLTDGGEGNSGHKHTEASKLKMSIAQKKRYKENPEKILRGRFHPSFGKPGPNKGKHHSQESKDLLSKIQTGKSYEDKVGTEKAKEWKEKIRLKGLGRKFSKKTRRKMSKSISAAMIGKSYIERFGSVEKAKAIIDKRRPKLMIPCTEEKKAKLRLHVGWKHSKKARMIMSKKRMGKSPWNKGAAVYLQYDLNNNYIQEVSDLKKLGFTPPNVIHCCNGKRKSAGGFIWKYKPANPKPEFPSRVKEKIYQGEDL